MTVFESKIALRKVAKAIVELGYAPAGVLTRNLPIAKDELQALCPNADVRYVYAGGDLFVDANRWPAGPNAWNKFAAALADNPNLTPQGHGVVPVKDG